MGRAGYTASARSRSMTHATDTLTSPDGLRLFVRRWTPDRPTRAVVVLAHGLHEHSGRYAYVASALMRRGIAVRALDLRGHGKSDGPRGQIETFSDLQDDLGTLLDATLTEVADPESRAEAPVFLMGHSLGGLVVAATVVDRGTAGLAGVILSSPLLRVPDDTAPLMKKVAPYVSKWFPNAPAARIDPADLSRDPAVGRAYKEDPLTINRGVRARMAFEILQTTERVRQHPEAFRVPLYLFHGTADRLTDPQGTEALAPRAATDDVTLTLYDGFFHETLNEPERDQVVDALADWIEAHIPPEST